VEQVLELLLLRALLLFLPLLLFVAAFIMRAAVEIWSPAQAPKWWLLLLPWDTRWCSLADTEILLLDRENK
jgi:hypothetical protein